MRPSEALVTGGAGFIGSHLVDELIKQNYEVTVLDNLSTGRLKNIEHHMGKKKFKFIEGDIRDYNIVNCVLKNVDVVFHQCASVGISVANPQIDFETNVIGTFNVLKACVKRKTKKIVYASSVMVYGELKNKFLVNEEKVTDPIIPYGASKLAGEKYCLAFYHTFGLKPVILRYFNVYGPRCDPQNPYSGVITKFIDRVINKKPPIIYGDGKQTRDFVYVSDVVNASILANEREAAVGMTFNIGSGIQTKINHIADLIIKATDSERKIKPRHTKPRLHEYRHVVADITKARKILGYTPQIGIKEGISKQILEYESHPQ